MWIADAKRPGEGGRLNADSCGQGGEGGLKLAKSCGHLLCMNPKRNNQHLIILSLKYIHSNANAIVF